MGGVGKSVLLFVSQKTSALVFQHAVLWSYTGTDSKHTHTLGVHTALLYLGDEADLPPVEGIVERLPLDLH